MFVYIQFYYKKKTRRFKIKDMVVSRFTQLTIRKGDKLQIKGIGKMKVKYAAVRGNMIVLECNLFHVSSKFKR